MNTSRIASIFARCAALFAVAAFAVAGGTALAQQQSAQAAQAGQEANVDPPGRVATITAVQGSVVFAPAGESEWTDLPRNRPITRGDRLWTDDNARAELHLGSSVVHMDSRTFLEVVAIDDDVVQLAVNEGSVNARARELRAGDNFEISTPQLALRATQPGDWRIDVDKQNGSTRITAHSGVAVAYGAGGNVKQIVAGQQIAFSGRDLAQLSNVPGVADNGFDRWALDRNRAEDQSVAARYIPREVVGYSELDQNGTWSQDPSYGTVWYPQVAVADWAPYRYGRWDFIAPWGWTWVDDAPWGFAPFHYGRWTVIGSRWAWVPGPMGRHPVYAPALVAFIGGSNVSFSGSGGPGIGWYPLAPGEVWRPFFNASPVYARNVNRYLVTDSRYFNTGTHFFMRRPDAITSVRIDDFNRGRPVHSRWTHVSAGDLARVQQIVPPTPSREMRREFFRDQRAINNTPSVQSQGRVQPPVQPRTQLFQHPQPDGVVREQQARQQQWREQQQAVQAHQRVDAVRQQHEAAARQQQEAARQQQAARESQRQQAWQQRQQAVQQQQVQVQQQHQRQQAQWQQAQQQQQVQQVQQQRAWAAQQQRHAAPPAQQAHERRDERRDQRQAQRGEEDNRGHRRW